MDYDLNGEDFLELWMFFEKDASEAKSAMFNTVAWISGFSSALLGFIVLIFTNYDDSQSLIPAPILLAAASFAGIILCFYADASLKEAKKHIISNFTMANRCGSKIGGLERLLGTDRAFDNKIDSVPAEERLRKIVCMFAYIFIVIFLSSPVWFFV